jgi:TonB-dependent receptor
MSEADHDNPVQTTLLFDWNNIQQFTYDFRGNNRLPVINFGNTNLVSTVNGTPRLDTGSGAATVFNTTDSNGWYLSQIRLRPTQTTNEFKNYQIDADWEASELLSFKGGVQLKNFEFRSIDSRIDPAFCTPAQPQTANAEGCSANALRTIPIASYSRVFSYGSDLGIPSGSNTTFLIPDMNAATSALGLNSIPVSSTTSAALTNNLRVEEEDLGYFAQAQLSTDIAGMPLRGNLGVRYVQTDQTSFGFSFLSGQAVLIKAEREYSDTLPSLNLSLGVTDEFIVRAAAAKVMSRAALGNLSPGGTVSVAGNARTAQLGNPNIDPTRAKAYDLSFEWYFARESLLSLALFYKDIESRAVSVVLNDQVFTGNPFGIPDSVAVQACGSLPNCAPGLAIWDFTTTVNGPGGDLKGFEISYQQPFVFLPGIWSNFGVQLNYTGVDSEINYAAGVTNDLVGLSRSAYNATLYYETERFGARVSAAYRDEFLTQVPGRNGNDVEGTAEVTTVDASARYSFNDNLDLTLEAINLTDEFQDQYVDSAGDRLSYYHHTGRSYLLGARYKF